MSANAKVVTLQTYMVHNLFFTVVFGHCLKFAAKTLAWIYNDLSQFNGTFFYRQESYKEYKRETSILVPLPNVCFRRVPKVIKVFLFCDFYNYIKEADEVIEISPVPYA